MAKSSSLQLLGGRAGILPEYVNHDGTQRIVTPDETYQAILRSMGYTVDDEASIQRGLQSLSEQEGDRATPSTFPLKCTPCTQRSKKPQLRGIWTNLYTLRSQTNWGVGDFGDLRILIRWAGETGLAFVALNPLHALRNRGHDVSPYRPVSRLYRNEIYLEMEAIPEFAESDAVKERTASKEVKSKLDQARAGNLVAYEAVASLKREILRLLHRKFQEMHGAEHTQRGQAFRKYLDQQGAVLLSFATFMVLNERFAPLDGESLDWRKWPDGLSDSWSPAVEKFQHHHADEIDFHCFVQFELDRQLTALADLAKASGLEVGLFGDLAIGTAPDGSDPWAHRDLFLDGVSIGAPPDDLGPAGQNWGLPPIHNLVPRGTSSAFWRRLLRNNLAHMGALRIDHVMGLFRQFWIPDGFDGSKGAYVRYPAEELFSLLAEESRRSGAIMVGEDLGTVPEGFRELLQRFGVLSTKVVYFEREWDGAFKPAISYPPNAYVVVGTHDMAPLAGFAEGSDLQLRRQVGLIPDDASLREACDRRKNEWMALLAQIDNESFQVNRQQGQTESVCRALIGFLSKTPACMVGISLDDLAGQREPVNVPGVGQDRHPSWSRRMTMSLEEIVTSPTIRDAVL